MCIHTFRAKFKFNVLGKDHLILVSLPDQDLRLRDVVLKFLEKTVNKGNLLCIRLKKTALAALNIPYNF